MSCTRFRPPSPKKQKRKKRESGKESPPASGERNARKIKEKHRKRTRIRKKEIRPASRRKEEREKKKKEVPTWRRLRKEQERRKRKNPHQEVEIIRTTRRVAASLPVSRVGSRRERSTRHLALVIDQRRFNDGADIGVLFAELRRDLT